MKQDCEVNLWRTFSEALTKLLVWGTSSLVTVAIIFFNLGHISFFLYRGSNGSFDAPYSMHKTACPTLPGGKLKNGQRHSCLPE